MRRLALALTSTLLACGSGETQSDSIDSSCAAWRRATQTPHVPMLAADLASNVYLWLPGLPFPASAPLRLEGAPLGVEASLVKLSPAGDVVWSLESVADEVVETVAPIDATDVIALVQTSKPTTILGAAVDKGRSLVTIDTNADAVTSVVSIDFGDLEGVVIAPLGADRLAVQGTCNATAGSAGCFIGRPQFATPYGHVDAFVGVVGRDAAASWQHAFGSTDARSQVDVRTRVTPVGSVVVAGTSNATLTLDGTKIGSHPRQAFDAVFAADGAPLAVNVLEGSGVTCVSGIAVEGDGSFAVVGDADGDVDLGSGPIAGLHGSFAAVHTSSGSLDFVSLVAPPISLGFGCYDGSSTMFASPGPENRWVTARAASGSSATLAIDVWSHRFDAHATTTLDLVVALDEPVTMQPAPCGDAFVATVDASGQPVMARVSLKSP